MTTTTNARRHEPVVTRHPIRGAIWGLLLGLSIAIYLVLFRVVPFGDWLVLGLVVLGGIALGVLWAFVAPPKRPKDEPQDVVQETTIERTVVATDETPRGIIHGGDRHDDAGHDGGHDGGSDDGGSDDGGSDDGGD